MATRRRAGRASISVLVAVGACSNRGEAPKGISGFQGPSRSTHSDPAEVPEYGSPAEEIVSNKPRLRAAVRGRPVSLTEKALQGPPQRTAPHGELASKRS